MYSTLLSIHDLLRWLVIFGGLAASATAIRAAASNRLPTGTPALVFTICYDVQVLVGALLYLRFSPITTTALHHFDLAMRSDLLRFWAVEHPVGMIVGLVLAHIGRAKLGMAATTPGSARPAAIYLTLAFLVAVISTPWPFMPYGRPLL